MSWFKCAKPRSIICSSRYGTIQQQWRQVVKARPHAEEERSGEEEEWRSAREKREWVKGQVHSVSLV